MIAFDVAAEASIGALCAAVNHRTGFRDGLLVAALVYLPPCLLSAWLWPGWQGMYIVPAAPQSPAALGFAVASALVLVGAFVGGYAVARASLARFGGATVLAAAIVTWAAVLIWLFGAWWRRALTQVSHAEFVSQTDAVISTGALSWGGSDAVLGGPVTALIVVSAVFDIAAVWWLLNRGEQMLVETMATHELTGEDCLDMSSGALAAAFARMPPPTPEALQGDWHIVLLAGRVFPLGRRWGVRFANLGWFPMRDKHFDVDKKIGWVTYRYGSIGFDAGEFEIAEGPAECDGAPALVGDYAGFPRTREDIRVASPDLLVGRFYVMAFGAPRFVTWFALERGLR